MKTYKAKVSATVELTATIRESDNGECEIVEVDEITEIEDFDNVRPLD